MKLTIAGLHVETGEALQTHCEEKMRELKKFFEHVIDVDVSLREERGQHLAEATVHANGVHLRAIGEGRDFYTAIDDAEAKLTRQLKRYKGRMNKHLKNRVTHAERLEKLAKLEAVHHTVEEESLENVPDDWFADLAPVIRHKEVKDIEPMNVDDAVMQMDLLHKPAYLFQNAQTGNLNVVYRDSDGSVRWVEPVG
jgi:putative sigma-54 modulation protein